MVGFFPGRFSFTRWLVRNLRYFISLDSQPFPHWTSWGTVHAPRVRAVLVVPESHTSSLSPWWNVFSDFIRGKYINTRSHRIPAGVLHQSDLLPHSLDARLVGAPSAALTSLHVRFVDLSRPSDGASWRINIVLNSKVVSNYVRQSDEFLIADSSFLSWRLLVSLL